MFGPYLVAQLLAALLYLSFLPFGQPTVIPHTDQCECDSLPVAEHDSCLDNCIHTERQSEPLHASRRPTLNQLSSYEMSIVSCCALNVHEHCCRSVRHLGLELASMQFALHELDDVSAHGDRHREHKRERERKVDGAEAHEDVDVPVHTDGDSDMIGFFGEKRSFMSDLEPGFFDEEKRDVNEAGVGPGFFGDEKRKRSVSNAEVGFFDDEKRKRSVNDAEVGFFGDEKRSMHDSEVGFFGDEKRKRSISNAEVGFFDDEKRKRSVGFFDDEKRKRSVNDAEVGFFGDEKRKRSVNDAEVGPGFFSEKKRSVTKNHESGFGPGFFDEEKRGDRRGQHGVERGISTEEIQKRLAAGRTFQSEPGFFGELNDEKRKIHRHGLKPHHKNHRTGHQTAAAAKQL